ncbi:hypothetical protein [Enterococcus faecalis]|uniref:hypothetical protein n=1 Tax=Enterococcus faecalis TaxID=1351 RepID=UPI001E353C7A|nr:hypothetical protein [Enterococcus faecalis]
MLIKVIRNAIKQVKIKVTTKKAGALIKKTSTIIPNLGKKLKFFSTKINSSAIKIFENKKNSEVIPMHFFKVNLCKLIFLS